MGASCSRVRDAEQAQRRQALSEGTGVEKPRQSAHSGSRHSPAGYGHLILKHAGDIRDVYEIDDKKIGEGSFGYVCLGTHKATGTVRAIKTVPRGSKREYVFLTKEIATMKTMDHPHIIRLFETFEDRRYIHFAMELCSGGELFDRIAKQKRFTEKQAAVVMQQILQSINYLHHRHIAHRDLKPENFLFLTKDPIEGNLLKLIDFGLACPCPPGKTLKTKVGTVFYMSPQILMGRYNLMCDVWSAGVIMYILLSGTLPFHGKTDQETFLRIRKGAFDMDGDVWSQISHDAKSLLHMLLKYSAQTRSTADDALKHDWILHLAPNASDKPLDSSVVDRLRAFKTRNQLKRAALELVVTQLNDSQKKAAREAFESLDTDADGELTMAELADGLERGGLLLSSLDRRQIIANLDGDKSGAIDYTEFLAATLDRQTALTEEVLWTAFNVFDRNGDGKISPEELKICLRGPQISNVLRQEAASQLLEEVDRNGDGFIDFEEFMALMKESSVGSLSSGAAAAGA